MIRTCIVQQRLSGALILLGCVGVAPAAIVYQNTTTRTGSYVDLAPNGLPGGPERGNTVTLAGSERRVTALELVVRSFGQGVTFYNVRIRFYANDGPAATPGTLLWDSGLLRWGSDAGGDMTFPFSVPNVVVPTTFTFSAQITDRIMEPGPISVATFAPPTVGTAPRGYWENNGAGWSYPNTTAAPFGARVVAEPVVPRTPADMNCDGALNNFDIDPFVLALTNPAGYAQAHPTCNVNNADINNDGQINNFDIDRFVACLTAGSCP